MSKTVTVTITGDASGLKSALGQAEKSVSSFESKASGVGDSLKNFGAKASRFSLPIVAAMGAATAAAVNLGEQVSKSSVVFGEASAEVRAFAKTASDKLGMSERAALEATGTFGNLFVSLKIGKREAADMSTKLVKLAADLASFNNVDPTEALDALRSGLVGETEPLKRFGVNLNEATLKAKAMEMGLSDGKATLDASAKAHAAFAAIIEQTAVAQGDFERTSGSLANQTRILKAKFEEAAAELGDNLIPIGLKAAEALNGMAEAFGGLSDSTQNTILMVGAFVAAVGPVSMLAGNAAKAVSALSKAYGFLVVTAGAASFAVAGLAAAAAGAALLYTETQRLRNALRGMDGALDDSSAATVNFAALAGDAGKATKDWAVEAYVSGAANKSMGEAARGAAGHQETLNRQIAAAQPVLDELSKQTTISKERIVQLANSLGINLGSMSEEAKLKLSGAIAEITKATTPTERLASVQETLGNAASTTAEAFDAFKEALDAALGVVLSADEAALKYQDRIDQMAASLTENGRTLDINTEKGRANKQALLDLIDAASGEVEALTKSGQISTDAATQKQALLDRLIGLKKLFPQLAAPIDEYAAHLYAIPDSKNTTVTANVSQALGAVTALATVFRDIPKNFHITGMGNIQARAHGGPVQAGRPYIVGEHRPELFVPNTNGTIIPKVPAMAGASAVGGGMTNITINMPPGSDGQDVVDAIKRYERRNGSGWRT